MTKRFRTPSAPMKKLVPLVATLALAVLSGCADSTAPKYHPSYFPTSTCVWDDWDNRCEGFVYSMAVGVNDTARANWTNSTGVPWIILSDTTGSRPALSTDKVVYPNLRSDVDGHYVSGIPVVWTSTDPDVINLATLDHFGKPGTVHIVATSRYNGQVYVDSTSITVKVCVMSGTTDECDP